MSLCELENKLYILSNTKVAAAKDHDENYMKIRLPLVRHRLQRNRLLSRRILLMLGFNVVKFFTNFRKYENNFILDILLIVKCYRHTFVLWSVVFLFSDFSMIKWSRTFNCVFHVSCTN